MTSYGGSPDYPLIHVTPMVVYLAPMDAMHYKTTRTRPCFLRLWRRVGNLSYSIFEPPV